jgi:hypothetical protein
MPVYLFDYEACYIIFLIVGAYRLCIINGAVSAIYIHTSNSRAQTRFYK